MNAFDIIIVILLALAAYRGFSRGLVSLAAQVLALLAGTLFCRTFGTAVAEWFAPVPAFAVRTVSNVVLFGIGYGLVMSMGRLIRQLFHALYLGMFDRLGGALFCMLEVGMVVSLLMNLWAWIIPSSVPDGSNTLRAVLFDLAPVVLGYL